MDDYATKGKAKMDYYDSVITKGDPDTAIVNTPEEVSKFAENKAFLNIKENTGKGGYLTTSQPLLSKTDYKGITYFQQKEIGFPPERRGPILQTTNARTDAPTAVINRGAYSKDGKFIVYQDAFKDNNVDLAHPLPLNEMGLQNFINAAGANTKNLETVFLSNIQNKEFWAITRNAYNNKKLDFDQVLSFKRGDSEFAQFMGSPNFNSKFFAFANHHNAVGNKVPSIIALMPKQASDDVLTGFWAAIRFEKSE